MSDSHAMDAQQAKAARALVGRFEVVLAFPVLYAGWECDPTAWIGRDADGRLHGLTTGHGAVCSMSADELLERLEEYRRVAALTQRALLMLRKQEGGA
ncbi:hypothetical protein JYK14_07770 [Siccirubricoccus sp. KC 17139]|uniref:Uncharacterized protein n=1 Tax=Siccirubricoccus soli TaxID=2899147 RepID=A0ABT1D2E2_9PROT|nr:hypothetical protein [Siccirubricoccus soli]MCO6416067.1 hypothetical protein [Siccirubricoccus soli]MCP2682199.1 hypothetical protein [Siccirubricoccus soli]